MSSSPVSYVAPMRECSVLIGTFMGARFLAEKQSCSRLGSACVILAGIILLARGEEEISWLPTGLLAPESALQSA